MDELDAPVDPEELYRDRGDIPVAVPLMQGDVFDGIVVPGLSADPITVQVLLHPCSMRNGATLRHRIAVAPVDVLPGGYSSKAAAAQRLWATKHVNRMLLPELREDTTAYAADFLDTAPVAASDLVLGQRIATLSNAGVVLLQQRMVYSFTRTHPPKQDFEAALEPNFTELEMQESWVECAWPGATAEAAEGLQEAITDFHAWLDENDGERRRKLSVGSTHSALRRELAAELRRRLGS